MTIEARKERVKEERKQKILSVALRLFKEGGLEAVSMRAIAEKIDYSPTTIYRDFKDKNDLLFALHAEGFKILYVRQMAVQEIEEPLERLVAHGREFIAFALENPEYYDLMFINNSIADVFCPDIRCEAGDRSEEVLKRNIADCIKAGYLSGEDPEGAIFLVMSTAHGIASFLLRLRLKKVPQDYLDRLMNNALLTLRSMVAGTKKREFAD